MFIYLLAFGVAIGFAGVYLVLSISRDKKRIRRHFIHKGYESIEIEWAPFGPGFLGDSDNRIYHVGYTEEGVYHSKYVKTNLGAAVYYTDEK
ncbi:hypothetical protein ACR6HW_01865 [Fusibacter sp. JL298sf-3]